MHLNTFLDVCWLLVQTVSRDTCVMVIMALGWGLVMVCRPGWGERRKGPVSLLLGSRDIYLLFKNAQHLESLVSHHHLYS